ncbi:MAG: hypothetical protein A2506_02665 [Elusimicrobia bacterium RIFOXYD12_FULL_66_9]|nr:MAG: hypothetical protein A2506_02665 [Elusimicrobia bacterium RIFOXYD12_FULL_66_9]
MAGLRAVAEKSDVIGEVRGKGLMIGVEMVKSKKTKEPAPELALSIVEKMKDLGVLIGKGGLEGSTLRIKPPLCFTEADAKRTCEALAQAI